MKIGERVSVTITKGRYEGKTLLLDVEEFQPVEPSMYVWTAGWNCAVEIEGESVWFWIDECGEVYGVDFDTFRVGICPAQEVEYQQRCQREIEVERHYAACTCGDPGDCGNDHA